MDQILVTGFPGFIAGRLIHELSYMYDNPTFHLFVHPTQVMKAKEKIKNIVETYKTNSNIFKIIEGDISKDNLGLTTNDLNSLKENIHYVFHLAAIYDLSVPKNLAYNVNVNGTRNIITLCKNLKYLRRFNYISTCYVVGKRSGIIFEQEINENQSFNNYYEETKYWAELDVVMSQKDIPTTIYRPPIVIGDSKTGETEKFDGPYFVLLFLKKYAKYFPYIINLGFKHAFVNTMPVDFVVQAISRISKKDETVGKTYQLADPHPPTTEEYFEYICKAIGLKNPIKINFLKPIVLNILKTKSGGYLTKIPKEAIVYFQHEARFSVINTIEALKDTGIKIPYYKEYYPKIFDYINKVVDYK